MAEKVSVVIEVDSSGAVTAFKSAGDAAQQFGQNASNASGSVENVGRAAGSAQTSVAGVGAASKEAAGGMGAMGAAAKENEGLFSRMSSALGMSTSSFAALITTVAGAVGAYQAARAALEGFMSVVDRAGAIDDLSQKIGVAGETLSQFQLAAQTTGTSLEGIGVGFKMLSKNLTDAAAGGSDSANALRSAFETMGVDVTASLTDTNSAMMALADQFAVMPDGAQKTALAMELFGKAGAELIPFLNQGSEGIAKMTTLNEALGLSMSEGSIKALDNFGDQLTVLGNVGTGVFTQLAAGAAPVLSAMADALVDMAAQAGINSGALQEWGQTIATTVVNAIATALGAIGQFMVDVANAGIGQAIYNAFATGLSAVGALAASAMASVKASIYDALSVLPLIGSSYAEAAANMRASAASFLDGVTQIGQGSTAIGNAGQVLLDTSERLKGVAASASEAGGAMSSAADGSDQMSVGAATVSTSADVATAALQKLKGGGDAAAEGTAAAAGGAAEMGGAASEAAGGVDSMSQALERLGKESTDLENKGRVWDLYISGAINYEEALIALQMAQKGGAEASQDIAVAMEAERVARLEASVALRQQTAELMNKNALSQTEVTALQAAIAASKSYEDAQLAVTTAVIQYQADQKVAAGMTGEQVAAWAEAQIQAAQYKTRIEDLNTVLKNADRIRDLQLELTLNKQVAAGIITKTQAERQMAVAAAGTNETLREQAGQIFDLTKEVEDAKDSFVGIGDILTGAFDQAFDAVISGTRDLGDALEGIALGIGKRIFSNMLEAKFKDFDPTMKKNFLDLGSFGSGVFGKMFSGVVDFGKSIFSGGGGGSSGGGFFSGLFSGLKGLAQGLPLIGGLFGGGAPAPDYTGGGYTGVGSLAYQGEPDYLGAGAGALGGAASLAKTATAETNSFASALGAVASIAAIASAVLPLLIPIFEKLLDTTTKGTKQRRKGESELDSSATFSKLQDKSKLGDFTRDTNKDLGIFDNYRTGVATAIERGMKEGEANAIKGAGQGLFSVIFKGDGDKMVNGAMDMGRGMAEFLSRGLADGMTYDEMLASLRSFASENDIAFKDALIGVNNFGKAAMEQFAKVGHAEWGAQEFADGIYGITEIFKGDFPAGVNLASIALQTMEKDGQKAFANLDAGTKQFILSVSNDAEAFKTVFATLAEQGFTIDTAEYEQTLADITASAQFVGANIAQLLSADTIGQGMQGLGEALKAEIKGALGDSMLGDLFDTTGIATAFQDLFSNINRLKSGEMSSGDFMSGMAEAIATGKANLEEYLPRIKAMRDAMAEVEAAVDEAFKPTAAEELAAATEAMAAGLKQSFGVGLGAALDAALADGGSREAGIAAFAESMRGSIKDSVKNSIVQGMVEAAVMQGPLAEMMATFGQAFKGALEGGITGEEQAFLDAYLARIGTVSEQTISALGPSLDTVLKLGEAADNTFGKMGGKTVGVPTDPALEQFKKDVEEAQTTLKAGFSSAVSEAFSMIGQGKSVEEATAAFSESFKTSISQSVAQGLQEALVQSAVMEGALGTMMAEFKTMTAAAMADGVITGAEQAQLAGMAQQIKTTGEAAANALAPVVASVATIATGVASGTDSVSFAVNSNAEASAAAADTAIATSTTAATATVTGATTSAAATVSGAVTQASGAYQELVTAASGAATEITGGAEAAATTVAGALSEAGETLSGGATMAAEQAKQLAASGAGELSAALGELSASAGEVTGAGASVNEAFQQASAALSSAAGEAASASSDTLTTAYSEAAAKAAAALDAGGTTISTDFAAATSSLSTALNSILGTGDEISDMAPDAAYGIGQSLAAVRDKVAPEMQTQIDALIGSLADASLSPEESERVQQMMASLGGLGTAMTPEMAAQANAVISAVGSIGADVDPATIASTQQALSSLATLGADVDPAGMEQFSAVTAALAEGSAALGDPGAVVDTMKALGDAALSSSDAANLAGTMQALGAAALDSGTAADMGATIKAFAAASAEGASNTTAIIDAFSAIDAGTSGKVQESLTALVSNGVAAGAAALSETLGGEGPDAIVSGLETLQAQLDAGTLSSLTDPLNDALGSVVSPADSIRSALDQLKDPTREVTDDMGSLGDAVRAAVSAINSAASSVRSGSPVPGAATGGSFSAGSAVVGEAGKPELVTANQGGGFTVTPLSWSAADSLMSGGTPGLAMGGIVGGGTGGIGGGGGGLPAPPPRGGGYTPGAEGAEFADFTSAIVEAFRAGLEGSKGFIEDFSDAINESVRTRLIDAIMQGFAEGPAIQGYADAIDGLITKAQTLAGNNQLTAEELANIQAQIKTNTDAIGAQADAIDELLEPMRQAEAISTAISDGLDFSGALKSLALNPDDLEGFRRSIDQTVNDAVLNGAIQGLLASGPIQDAIKSFGDEMNTAMAAALEDGVITAEESDALHNLAVTGSEEMKTAMEALGPVLSALGIDLGDSLSDGVNRAKEMMQSASSAMDPFAGLGEGETQFGNFTQNIRDQVYGNIRDGLVQAFIDSAVTQGLLAGPMMAIQGIFDQIGQKQLTTAEANAKIAEQVGIINGSLNDPAFKTAFDSTMASIQSIGSQLGQTTQTVERATTTATRAVDTTKDVCKTGCELQARTRNLGDTAMNTFGRNAGISIEDFETKIPKLALGGLVKRKTLAYVGEAGPELVIPAKELAAAASAIERVDFDAARQSASAGLESMLASLIDGGGRPGGDLSAELAQAMSAIPTAMAGATAGNPAEVAELAEKLANQAKVSGDDTVSAIEDLQSAMADIAKALKEQPAQTDIRIDGEVLVRAMTKARKLARKAGVEV